MGTFRGILRGPTGFGATVLGEQGIVPAGKLEGYEPLRLKIARFFRPGQPPMTVEPTRKIYAFMEADDESLRQGGRPVSLSSVLEHARKEASRVCITK